MYEYIYIIIVFLIILWFAHTKIKYPFWNIQPVFHTYDYWRYYAGSPFIIQKQYPIKTKFSCFELVKTQPFSESSETLCKQYIELLQSHYIESDRILVTLNEENLSAYFVGHNHPSYLSFYNEKRYMYEGSQTPSTTSAEFHRFPTTIVSGNLQTPSNNVSGNLQTPSNNVSENLQISVIDYPVGCMSSRPINILMESTVPDKVVSHIRAFFWDFICIHREHRPKKIVRNLIQTHEYNQRIRNPDISVSLFKKEIDLCEGIVPLTTYTSYTFYLRNIKVPPLPPHFSIIRIFKDNLDILSDFLYMMTHSDKRLFAFCAIPDTGSLTSLIHSKNLYVYCLKRGEHVYGMYFVKDAKTRYEDLDGGTLQCIGSVMNSNSASLFAHGFAHSIREILKLDKTFKMLIIDDNSHNSTILWKWREKHNIVFETPTAYYLYNFVYPGSPLLCQKCICLL
jgi:hypothetical protein